MNHDFSQLNLVELCDKLSECTDLYSKSKLNSFSDMEFVELRALIEALQKEIAKRKPKKGGGDDSSFLFPPKQSKGNWQYWQEPTGNRQFTIAKRLA